MANRLTVTVALNAWPIHQSVYTMREDGSLGARYVDIEDALRVVEFAMIDYFNEEAKK